MQVCTALACAASAVGAHIVPVFRPGAPVQVCPEPPGCWVAKRPYKILRQFGPHERETRSSRSPPDVKRRELSETGFLFAALGRHGLCVIWGGSVVRTPIVGVAVGASVGVGLGVGVDVEVGDRVGVAGPRYTVKLTESQGL